MANIQQNKFYIFNGSALNVINAACKKVLHPLEALERTGKQ